MSSGAQQAPSQLPAFVVGSDHGGCTLRDLLVQQLREAGHEVLAIEGPADASSAVDYPDVARTVCASVVAAPGRLGLLVCGTGQGMAISANKVAGIRAGVVADPFSARMLREHNDANVLCLGERVLGVEVARELLRAFVAAGFAGGRHERRVEKINALLPSHAAARSASS